MYFERCVIRIIHMNRNSHLTLRSGAFTLLLCWQFLGSCNRRIVRDSGGNQIRQAWLMKNMTLVLCGGLIILQTWDATIGRPWELALESKLHVLALSLPDHLLWGEEWILPPCCQSRHLEGISWIKLACYLVFRERNLCTRVVLRRACWNCIQLICLLQLLQKGIQTLVNISERDYFHIFIRWTGDSIASLVLAPCGHAMPSSSTCTAIILVSTIWRLREILSSLWGMMIPRRLVSSLQGNVESRPVPEILRLSKVVAPGHLILLETHIRVSLVMVATTWPGGTTSENWETWLLGVKLIHEWLRGLLSK